MQPDLPSGAPGATVRMILNGAPADVPRGARLVDVLASMGIDGRRIAVERNGEVVPRHATQGIVIGDGDVYEVVHFVGGG